MLNGLEGPSKKGIMNKRQLKRNLNHVCSDLFAEGVSVSLYSNLSNQENIKALLASIITIQIDFIRRISHPEPGIDAKRYYRHLIKEFNNAVSEVIDHIAHIQ